MAAVKLRTAKEGVTDRMNEDGINEVVENLSSIEGEIQETPLDTPQVMVRTKKEKLVSVRTIKFHRCTIGGITYEFEKGVEKLVPLHVKMTLLKQNILKA